MHFLYLLRTLLRSLLLHDPLGVHPRNPNTNASIHLMQSNAFKHSPLKGAGVLVLHEDSQKVSEFVFDTF